MRKIYFPILPEPIPIVLAVHFRMASYSEQETLDRALAGDQQAFRILVETYQSFVYSVAYRMVRHPAEADDLTQETFIRMWKNLHRYNPTYTLKAWLGKIVINLTLDLLKSNDRKRTMRQSELTAFENISNHQTPEHELHASQLSEIIVAASTQLPPNQQAVFVLRDMEQLDVAEVCEALNMQASQVKSNLYYARLHIKNVLNKVYPNLS
jgi:RNA polymerase sigma-70 factor, ECF subfamily